MSNKALPTFKKELFKILFYTCGMALSLNFIVAMVREYYWDAELSKQNIQTAANILAHNLVAPLAFNDKKDAASQLRFLQVQMNFMQANLYDKNGTKVTSFGNNDSFSKISPEIIGKDIIINHSFNYLEVWKTIVENEQLFGYLQIRVAQHLFSPKFFSTLAILFCLIFISLILSLSIGRNLLNKIAKTLEHFVAITKQVSTSGFEKFHFATPIGQEAQLQEFALLGKSFEQMLKKIWAQDTFICEYNDALERKVVERTYELTNERAKTIHSAQLAALGEMAAKIAHEINNPLTIVASVQVILKRYMDESVLDKKKIYKQLENLELTTKRMSQTVMSVRNLSRDASSDPHLKTCLAPILRDVLTISAPQLKIAQVELKLDLELPEYQIEFMAQPAQLAQIFINLMNNAVHAVQDLPQKWVKISAKVNDNFLIVDFMDSGPGIPIEIQQKMFAPFFTTKAVGIGTGLGLSISITILERHGGTLEIVQNLPNTCFRIKLPLNPSS